MSGATFHISEFRCIYRHCINHCCRR